MYVANLVLRFYAIMFTYLVYYLVFMSLSFLSIYDEFYLSYFILKAYFHPRSFAVACFCFGIALLLNGEL